MTSCTRWFFFTGPPAKSSKYRLACDKKCLKCSGTGWILVRLSSLMTKHISELMWNHSKWCPTFFWLPLVKYKEKSAQIQICFKFHPKGQVIIWSRFFSSILIVLFRDTPLGYLHCILVDSQIAKIVQNSQIWLSIAIWLSTSMQWR